MKYRLSKRAEASIDRIDLWWRANKAAAPSAFDLGVSATLAVLTSAPLSGSQWAIRKGVRVRRLLLASNKHYLYYTIEEDETVVLDVHPNRRLRGPALGQ